MRPHRLPRCQGLSHQLPRGLHPALLAGSCKGLCKAGSHGRPGGHIGGKQRQVGGGPALLQPEQSVRLLLGSIYTVAGGGLCWWC